MLTTYKYKKKKVKHIIDEESKTPLGIVWDPSSGKALNIADILLSYGIINKNKILVTCLRAGKKYKETC